MSITFFALYFSSRASTVNSTSRAGFERAKLAVRWIAWKAMTTSSAGVKASTSEADAEHQRQESRPRARRRSA